MNLEACLENLPAGYRVLREKRGVLAVLAEHAEQLERAGFGPDGRTDFPPSGLTGRQPLGSIPVGARSPGPDRETAPGNDEEWLLRSFHHGGLLRRISGTRFRDPTRPFLELTWASALSAAGLHTPRVIAARAQRAPGWGWHLDLVTRRVQGTHNAVQVLERLRDLDAKEVLTRQLVGHIGQAVGELHRASFLHADLHPRNLLVDDAFFQGGTPRVWVLDLDRGRHGEALADSERARNLSRLLRYILRRSELAALLLERGMLARFLRSYHTGLRGLDARRESTGDWKADWRAVQQLLGKTLRTHRLGWRLEDLVGGGARARDPRG